jgi:hypothetical protein
MSRIGRAAVYKFVKTGKFLVYCVSKIEMGAGIATEPFIWLEKGATSEQVVTASLVAMSQSKIGLPNPKDWPSFAKDFIKNIGLAKESDLYKNSISLSVLHMDKTITFSPMKNNGGKGYVNVKDSEIKLKDDAGIEELIEAFELALSRCE